MTVNPAITTSIHPNTKQPLSVPEYKELGTCMFPPTRLLHMMWPLPSSILHLLPLLSYNQYLAPMHSYQGECDTGITLPHSPETLKGGDHQSSSRGWGVFTTLRSLGGSRGQCRLRRTLASQGATSLPLN